MPARTLTDSEVRGLQAEKEQRLVVYDAKARGLCLRVTAGTKSWSFVYRPRGRSQQRRYTIGDYPAWPLSAAREKALALRRLVQDGGDPVADARTRREALTVGDMIKRFITSAKNSGRLRSWRTYQDLLNRDIVPTIGERKAGEVSRAEVAKVLDKVAARAPVVGNRVQRTLSSVYSWAVSEGLVETNPVRGLKLRHVEVAKDRVLTDAEIVRFWAASADMPAAYQHAFRLILLTGQRPGEVAGITATEVDAHNGLWRLSATRTKNKQPHAIPLVGEALDIVRKLVAVPSNGPLLRTPRGGRAITAQDAAKAFERLREGKVFDEGKVTPHDLRRAAATILARLEVDRMTIAFVLNHASTTKASVTGSTYDRHDYIPRSAARS